MQHFDGRSVELREYVAGDDLGNRAERCPTVPEVQDTIHGLEQRVELMCGEEHGDALGLLDPLDQRDGRLLEMRIEAQQRFIEQKQLRLA